MKSFDVAIVGAGIIGLAHAYAFAKRGARVVVFEGRPRATGASIRNFGMVWTIGQPPGKPLAIATRSNEIWCEVLDAAGLWYDRCGALHLAYADDEAAVLTEFAERGPTLGYSCEWLDAEVIEGLAPNVKTTGLRGGLLGLRELCVDPRKTIAALPEFLAREFGVQFHFSTLVTRVVDQIVGGPDLAVEADRVVICSGDDYETLYPELFADSAFSRCRLQMLRARYRDAAPRNGPHLCAGLTLLRYANFSICDSLGALRDRVERTQPEYLDHGIHLLVSQHEHGELTIGDSHHSGRVVEPFLYESVDALMWRYLDTFLDVSRLEITQRWQGVYGTYSKGPYFDFRIDDRVRVVTGVGGAGMTLSFGLADRTATS